MNIYVIGSINMDMVIKVKDIPEAGMTVNGSHFFKNPGGKGANQAVAISKSNKEVKFIGAVGNEFGTDLIDVLNNQNIDTSNIKRHDDVSSGIAMIILDKNADNRIILDSGANFKITKDQIDEALINAKSGDFVLLQFEIPIDIVMYTLKVSKSKGLITFLNPTPAKEIPTEYYKYIDYFIINQSESEFYTNIYPKNIKDAKDAGIILNNKGINCVIITLGSKGSFYLDKNNTHFEKAINTKVVDTTAAGDTYIGAFVSKLSETNKIDDAMNYASFASSITISRLGAQKAIPTKEEIDRLRNK